MVLALLVESDLSLSDSAVEEIVDNVVVINILLSKYSVFGNYCIFLPSKF
jgi:hypothetical protein